MNANTGGYHVGSSTTSTALQPVCGQTIAWEKTKENCRSTRSPAEQSLHTVYWEVSLYNGECEFGIILHYILLNT